MRAQRRPIPNPMRVDMVRTKRMSARAFWTKAPGLIIILIRVMAITMLTASVITDSIIAKTFKSPSLEVAFS